MSKLLLNECYFLNEDEDGREWLCDSISRWIPREYAIKLRDILDLYINDFTEEEITANFNNFLESRKNAPTIKHVPKKEVGFVYLLKNDVGQCKIGKTKRLGKRMSHFGIKLPFPIRLVGYIKSPDYDLLEKQYHKKYNGCRLLGEWFNLTVKNLQDIMSHPDFKFVDKELN